MNTREDIQRSLAELSAQREAVKREWEGRSLRSCLWEELASVLASRRATEAEAIGNMVSFEVGVGL
jgi:hypothetical protein